MIFQLNNVDKQAGKSEKEIEEASAKFKELSDFYQVLIDPTKREFYDKTGEVPENKESFLPQDGNWKEYFDALYQRITTEMVTEYEKKYRCNYLKMVLI